MILNDDEINEHKEIIIKNMLQQYEHGKEWDKLGIIGGGGSIAYNSASKLKNAGVDPEPIFEEAKEMARAKGLLKEE